MRKEAVLTSLESPNTVNLKWFCWLMKASGESFASSFSTFLIESSHIHCLLIIKINTIYIHSRTTFQRERVSQKSSILALMTFSAKKLHYFSLFLNVKKIVSLVSSVSQACACFFAYHLSICFSSPSSKTNICKESKSRGSESKSESDLHQCQRLFFALSYYFYFLY